jgi:exonuclease SbcC
MFIFLPRSKSQQELAPERERLNRLEIFSSIRPTVFQQQQLLKTEQQLAPQIQKQQQLFDSIQSQFETEKSRFTRAETAFTEQQNFENIHGESLSEVRKCVQERDFLQVNIKKSVQNSPN